MPSIKNNMQAVVRYGLVCQSWIKKLLYLLTLLTWCTCTTNTSSNNIKSDQINQISDVPHKEITW